MSGAGVRWQQSLIVFQGLTLAPHINCFSRADPRAPLAVYLNYTNGHPGATYDNAGWIKGTRQAYGDWGAFIWLLQNTISFTSSASSVYVSPNGATNTIASVLVGTLGDYCPQTVVTEVGPVFNTNYPGSNTGTDEVFRADTTAYYKLVPFSYLGVNNDDSDGDGIPDFADGYNQFGGTSDKSTNDFFTPWPLQLSSNANPAEALISITYDASDPANVNSTTNGYAADSNGYFRLWTKQGSKPRNKAAVTNGGDYIPSGTYAATALGFNLTNRIVEIYIEPINPTTNREIVIQVDPDGINATKGFVCQDKMGFGIVSIALTFRNSGTISPQTQNDKHDGLAAVIGTDDLGAALSVPSGGLARNTMEIIGEITPLAIAGQSSLYWDFKRDIESRKYLFTPADRAIPTQQPQIIDTNSPLNQDFAGGPPAANDDANDTDEDLTPTGGLIYSVDSPGMALAGASLANAPTGSIAAYRFNAKEWVRINTVADTRLIEWTSAATIRKRADGYWERVGLNEISEGHIVKEFLRDEAIAAMDE